MAQTIRFAAETDATQILDIYAPIVANTAISFEEVPLTRPEMAGRIRGTLERYPWLACKEAECVLDSAPPAAQGPVPDAPKSLREVSPACVALMASTV